MRPRKGFKEQRPRQDVASVILAWQKFAFGSFNYPVTKFSSWQKASHRKITLAGAAVKCFSYGENLAIQLNDN